MPKFVIERDIPGAGKLTPAELNSISLKSCGVLSSLGPSVQWVHSYITGDRGVDATVLELARRGIGGGTGRRVASEE